MPDLLPTPYGGSLVDLRVDAGRAAELRRGLVEWPSWDLTGPQLADLELLVTGGLSPLRGYLGRDAIAAVEATGRLPDGTRWPDPLTLVVPADAAGSLEAGSPLVLRDPEGVPLAVVSVEQRWAAGGPDDGWHLAGPVECLQVPVHHDFRGLRLTPAELRSVLAGIGATRVAALDPPGIMHRADIDWATAAAAGVGAHLLLHPSVGADRPDDVGHYSRVRCLRAAIDEIPAGAVTLALLPLAPRPTAGRAQAALLRAIVARNHGCSHVVGDPDDHDQDPDPDDHDRAALDEVGVARCEATRPRPILDAGELQRRLDTGADIPASFSPPGVVAELRRRHPPRREQGFTVLFTGLSGSGKSTIAQVLLSRFLEDGDRPATLLDGDLVRRHLSSELGFSKEHRDLNVRRIGYVAAQITAHGGIAICAPIAPYRSVRDDVRAMVSRAGGFVLVHVATPLEVCEARDRKGLYAKARAGVLAGFTGISDPYEAPDDAEVVIDTASTSPEEAAEAVIAHLVGAGYLPG